MTKQEVKQIADLLEPIVERKDRDIYVKSISCLDKESVRIVEAELYRRHPEWRDPVPQKVEKREWSILEPFMLLGFQLLVGGVGLILYWVVAAIVSGIGGLFG